MRFSKSVFTSVILAASILFAVMISGGCGGSSHNFANDNTEGGDPNGPDNYTSEVAEKLIARSDVHDLASYVKDTSLTIKKGEILLYYPVNGEDIKAYGNYWPRVSEALEKGAIISVFDIEAGEIDEITGKLRLNVPSYLPDNATEEEKAKLVDFYAFASRADGVDSQDSVVVNYYTFYGTDLYNASSMDMYVYSGDETAAFDSGECEEGEVDGEYYYIASEDRIVSEDPDPVLPYNHVDIVPVHNFTNGADYYFIQLLGASDTSDQYTHPSYVKARGELIFIYGSYNPKTGTKTANPDLKMSLEQDFILGYDYILGYDAYFKSGNNIDWKCH